MRIIINNGSTFKGGAEQVALSFIEECKKYTDNEYYVIIGQTLAPQINIHEYPDNFRFFILNKRPASGLITFIKSMQWFRKLERKIHPDCVISTGGHGGYWKPNVPTICGFNIPHHIYPESPYFKLISLKKRIYWEVRKYIDFLFFNKIDAIIVQTRDVGERLKKNVRNKPIYTVYNTIHSAFINGQYSIKKLPEQPSDEVRFLTVSSHYPHKNLVVIKKVIELLKETKYTNIRFVLTLPDEVFNRCFEDTYKGFIYNVGPVPIKEVPALYRECDFMFLPTLLECFSASYVEAMHMGKAILTSDLSFAHAVCKDAAIYFDPIDPYDIYYKMMVLIHNVPLQKELIANGKSRLASYNTPALRAQKYLDICRITAGTHLNINNKNVAFNKMVYVKK